MTDKNTLNFIYKQNLEEDIISGLADVLKIELREAMDLYYRSQLAGQIANGEYGIENMNYKYLIQDLIENESELLKIILK